MKYDSDKYFISGYSYGAEVYLTSTNRIKLDSEVNNDTRNFKIVADLTHSHPGTVSVNLRVENLPSGVTATVSPDKISVTIGKKNLRYFLLEEALMLNKLQMVMKLAKLKRG